MLNWLREVLWEPPAWKPRPPVKARPDRHTELRWYCDICHDQSNGLPSGVTTVPGSDEEIQYCTECDGARAIPETVASRWLLDAGYDVDRVEPWVLTGSVFYNGSYLPFAVWARVRFPDSLCVPSPTYGP